MYDVIIVGGGPAGLTAAIYSGRYRLKTLIIDAGIGGGGLAKVHRIDNYPGFKSISGIDLSQRILEQVKDLDVELHTMESVNVLKKKGDRFLVQTNKGEYEAKTLLITTGAKPLSVKGLGLQEEKYLGRGVSYCGTCDALFYKGKRVIVVGGNEEAIYDALYLAEIASDVKIVAEEFDCDEVCRTQLGEQRIERIHGKLERIIGNGKVTGVVVNGREIPADGIFINVGREPSTKLFETLGLRLKGRFIKVNENMETNIPGVYAAGDVTGFPFQVSKAVGQGATAAISIKKYIRS